MIENQMTFLTIKQHPKWNKEICPTLQQLANKQLDAKAVIQKLSYFKEVICWRRDNRFQYAKSSLSKLYMLQKHYSDKIVDLVSILAALILHFDTKTIPIFRTQQTLTYTFSKKQIYYLMSAMFMNLISRQNYDYKNDGKFNFDSTFFTILTDSQFKTKSIVEYLLAESKNFDVETARLTLKRNVVKSGLEDIIKEKGQYQMSQIIVESNEASIETFNGELKVDFANRFIGGGCLRSGATQEEIMFANHPEMYISTLLCQKMDENEALTFIGFKKYFKNTGYSRTTKFDGPEHTLYQIDQTTHEPKEYIVAIDALKFQKGDKNQFLSQLIKRQILKAYAGFSSLDLKLKVVSGNWGCGVYNGEHRVKTVIQWIAASLSKKTLLLCPFGCKKLVEHKQFLQYFKGWPINQFVKRFYWCLKQMKGEKDNIYEIMLRQE